jgi:peptidoglycan-N-acetylglucosamine deacetylase
MGHKVTQFFILTAFIFTSLPVSAFAMEEKAVEKPKVAYLTFDADMTPYMKKKLDTGKVKSWYSPTLVDYLETEKIPATMFVTGMFAEIYPDVVKEMASHSDIKIENHSYDHDGFESPCYGLKIAKTDKQKEVEIDKTQKIIESLTGYAPTYFRYPGLCRKKHDDMLVRQAGLTVADSGLVSGDAFAKGSKGIVKTVLKDMHDGQVVIMHLGGPNAAFTDVAVKEIVDALKKKDYIFKALGQ